MASITTPELVRLIKRENETPQQASDRIHYWVRAGAIRSVGKRHPGPGTKRRYPADTALRIVLLQAAREAGLSPDQAADMVQLPEYFAPLLDPTAEPPAKPLFVVLTTSDGSWPPHVSMRTWDELVKFKAGQGEVFDTCRVVDVGKIRARLDAALKGGANGDDPQT
jgi:hypothetical protein